MPLFNGKNELKPQEVPYHTHNGADSPKLKGVLDSIPQGAITKPTGGLTIDAQARSAINSIIDALSNTGIIQ